MRALAFEERADLEPGNVAWISHSGSAFSALLHAERGIHFNLAVSTGQELSTTMADYMLYALERDSTRVISLFLETIRDPDNFKRALATAAERDVPVVALKVGRATASRRLVAAHSGALAGDDAAYEALFDAYDVARVGTLNEMADLVELLAAGRRAAPGGLAAILDSGGERAHLVDAASGLDVPLAQPSEETLRGVAARLEPGLPAVNPLDAWGTDNDPYNIFLDCSRYLAEDPDTGAFAYVVDLHSEQGRAGPRLGRRAGLGLDGEAVRRGLRGHQRDPGERRNPPALQRDTGARGRKLRPARLPAPLRPARLARACFHDAPGSGARPRQTPLARSPGLR